MQIQRVSEWLSRRMFAAAWSAGVPATELLVMGGCSFEWRALRPERELRVGLLAHSERFASGVGRAQEAFLATLRERGSVEGQSPGIAWRFVGDHSDCCERRRPCWSTSPCMVARNVMQ